MNINDNLEAIAKQLYDYWFVQFDFPNEEGKPYKSSGGKMVWDEKLKREIPEGWYCGSLLEIAQYTNGLACQKFRPTDNNRLPVIKIKEMHDGISSETEFVKSDIPESVKVYNGDVLFSWSASLEVMLWAYGDGGLNQHIFKVTSNNGYPRSFYFYQLIDYIGNFKRMAEARKTTMGHITQDHLKQSTIALPPNTDIANKLEDMLSTVFDTIINNNQEIMNLTKQRDELLPLLMNGQVSVNYHLFFNLILPTIALHKKIFRHLSFVFRLFLYLLHKFIIMKEAGYVYILTNPSFKEDWVKIGKSSRPVDVRSKELDNTAVPLPFEIYATLKTVKYEQVEKLIHKTIDRLTDLRIRQNREFFNVSPAKALDILKDISTTLDDAEIDEVYLGEARFKKNIDGEEVAKKTRPRFKFSMVNIPIGATLTFVPTGINVKVADDDKIEYEGRLYKLSPFVGTFMPEDKRNTSGAYQGAKYFTYKGEILDDIRTRLEEV